MALETGVYIDSLNANNPVATDGISQADDHLRLIKSTVKSSFPSVAGAVNATHTEINTACDGSTSATSTTLVDADRVVVNDNGTMVQTAMSDVKTYMESNLNITASNIATNAVTASELADNAVDTAAIADGSITAAKLASGAVGGTGFFAGMVMPYGGNTAPTGWLMMYGQAISRTTYADLFQAIGTTYGAGDGTNSFNVPDLRGRTIAGQDDMGGGGSANRLTSPINGDTLGATGGSESHTLSEAELPAHTHGGGGTISIPVGENNTQPNNVSGLVSVTSSGNPATYTVSGTSGSVGSGTAHNNVQPTIILNYIIKT
ncbi:phage tail protein [Candidatus Puniceispirillum marinum]|uniref:phage tail protein n=1 Tax=Candidatus Puniceispirillum marinum TaxID=767892 RepID=UPI0002EA65B3|nr:tail fiber protein [Candidatus Puniceispirillum marinum]